MYVCVCVRGDPIMNAYVSLVYQIHVCEGKGEVTK